jgi:serine/threonine-protein kinase
MPAGRIRLQDFDLGGKYDIRGVLGRGAMGTVYDAWDPRIDRRVAIKTVRRSGGDDAGTAEALARFREEARAAGRLANPHIVGVYDYGETDAFAYIVMEFVEGRTLKARLDEAGRLQPAEAGRIMQQVLQGLAYSHARGVIHRDIKPANIILAAGGEAKIADFGVAKLENSEMTAAGTIIGTPAYMAPEQFLGVGVDSRSDIYSAGVTLFHMLTGERPYDGTMSAIMHRVLKTEEAPPRAAERQAGISPLLDAVIAKAMAKQQADRFEGAEAFSLALRIALEAPASADDDRTVVRPPPSAQAAAGGRKGLSLPVMFAVAGLCGAGLAGWFVWGRAPQAAPSRVAVEAPAAARPPAPPPPVPVRSSEDVQRNVAAALAGQPCVSATVGPASNGGAAVHVIAGKDFADHAHGLAVAAAAGAPCAEPSGPEHHGRPDEGRTRGRRQRAAGRRRHPAAGDRARLSGPSARGLLFERRHGGAFLSAPAGRRCIAARHGAAHQPQRHRAGRPALRHRHDPRARHLA